VKTENQKSRYVENKVINPMKFVCHKYKDYIMKKVHNLGNIKKRINFYVSYK